MRRIVLLLTTLLAAWWLASASYAESKPFITKWKGEAGEELKIPIFGNNYKLVIKKASDNTVLKTEASLTITENENFYTYTPIEDGELLVEAGPEGVEYIRFVEEESKRGSAKNLLTVEQFGTVAWKSMEEGFQYCNNMQFAATVGTPDLSHVTDMEYMFYECSAFNQDLSSWNVSNVTNMHGIFSGCSSFNQDLSGWNVSNVTDMGGMFYDCSAFNQNLGSWQLKECKKLGLQYCGMSIENYSKSLIGWAGQADIKANLLLEANNLHFNETAKNARTKLMKEKHWAILGDVSEGGKLYDLRIGGVQLSSDNIASFPEALTEAGVLKKGKVSVTLEGKKLILKLENAELTAPSDNFPTYMLENRGYEITIQLQGNCTITQLSDYSAISVGNGTIVGRNTDDKLSVKGGAVWFSTAIRNCTVEIEKVLEDRSGALEIDNAIVKAKSIQNVSSFTLKNCSILQPEGAHYDAAKREVVDKDGNTAENVVIGSTGGGTTVAVTGVKLSYNNLSLKTGDSFTLIATVEPANATNKAVTWSSDNDAVATVSDAGVVEAKTPGTANITVTAEDVVLTGITISPSETTLEVDKETTLSLSFTPVTATHKGVKWSSNDPTIATVDEHGKVKGIATGETTITVVSEKYESVTNTCKVTVIPPTAVEDAVFANVIVSPNPFETQLRISNGDVRGKYALYNAQGVVVLAGVLNDGETVLNTTELASGLYLLRLPAESGATKTYRVVKQ